MCYLIVFSSSESIKTQLGSLLSPSVSSLVTIETAPYPNGFVSLLPGGLPAAFIADTQNAPEQLQNPWLQLLPMQYPQIPYYNYDASPDFAEQLDKLAKTRSRSAAAPLASYAQTLAFLEQITSTPLIAGTEKLNFSAYTKYSFAACALMLTGNETIPSLRDACGNLVKQYPSSFCYINYQSNVLLFTLYAKTGDFTQLELNRQTFADKMQSEGNPCPPFKVGIIHHGLPGLISSYMEAVQVYYVNKLRTPCTYFDEISSPPGQPLKLQRLKEIERSIRTDIQFLEGQNVLQYVRLWFDECKNLNSTLNELKYDLINLYSTIKYVLFDMYNLKLKRIKSGLEVHEILNIATLEELERWFYNWLIYTLDNFDLTRSNTDFQIDEVLQFITNHITDGLTLTKISSYFYVNPSYLSTLFKKETGQTYISYVTKVKMEKACELLNSNFKVFEVSSMLGYEDIRHFRNTFKKYHGIPPSEYKAK
ncbi:Helix-turn-helix domain-containing protein [Anaerocolumna jejuensis DSM 15929]|uniref:Helix-turn-helix domain-containing protein n=1 Tax=Anaerocolumna jejuensis DSM 15929 TaxID=1121322 RepID=A0A1M7BJQ6_9FIRM|nr:helix-turn-helix domain-containing protein [Anaerocolumna jejuensis]SHL55167.1 Helix-turn-helix domain-containing protein [Anaerocolumna jejuensis DSM 15929]